MRTCQFYIAENFHIFDSSLMTSTHRTRNIILCVETRNILVKKSSWKLWIFQNIQLIGSVYILIEYTLRIQISLQKW